MKHFLFCAALAVCLLLAGCGAAAKTAPPAAETGGALVFLAPCSAYGSGGEAGYYYIATRENGDRLLRYVDYAALQDMALCSQPNCAHADESCPAWFAWGGTGLSVFAGPGALFLIHAGSPWSDWAFATYGAAALPRVEVCAPDGSGRRELAAFGAAEAFSSLPAADGEALYTIVTSYDDARGQATQKIVAIDLATGAVRADESVQRPELRIVGTWGRELILQSGSGRNYYAAYDVDTNALRELDAAGGEMAAAVGEGTLCRMDEATGAIRVVSVADGSVTQLATDLLDQCEPQWLRLTGVTEQGYVVQVAEADGYHNWLIDLAGGARRQPLQAQSTDANDKMRMLEIFARQGENYLVSPSRSYHTTRTPGPDGVTYGEDTVDYDFALISARDFWAGTANYRAVARIS